MKNTVKYYTREIEDLYYTSLEISSLPSFKSKKSKEERLLDEEEYKNKEDDLDFPTRLKININTSIYKINYLNALFKEHVTTDSIFKRTISIENNFNCLNQKNKEEILSEINELFNQEKVQISEELEFYDKFYDNNTDNYNNNLEINEDSNYITTKVNKISNRLNSSSLLYFNGCDIDNKKGTITVKNSIISFQEIIDLWVNRKCFFNKCHLFIIIETKTTNQVKEYNKFMEIIQANFFFKSVSLLILPRLDENIDFEFNKYNFIGNKITILRDFNINLIKNKQFLEVKKLNNLKIKNFGTDEDIEIKLKHKDKKDQKLLKCNKLCSIYYPNGEYYEGEVNKDNLPHGFGTFIYLNSTTYSGFFSLGKRNGKACFITPKYTTIIMKWDQDYQNGFMEEYDIDDKTLLFQGVVKKGKYHGPGILIENDKKFVGFFLKNMKIRGTLFQNINGSLNEIFKGEFTNEEPGELGKLTTYLSNKVRVDYGYIGKNKSNELITIKGAFYVNLVKDENKYYEVCYGKIPETLLYEPGVWKIDKSASNVSFKIRLQDYLLRHNLEKYSDSGDDDGYSGYLTFFNNDHYIGEIKNNLPSYYGILYRHDKDQYEIGDFEENGYNTFDDDGKTVNIRLYYLKTGLIIKKDNFGLFLIRNLTGDQIYYNSLYLNVLEKYTYKGILKAHFDYILCELNENDLKKVEKNDCKGRLYYTSNGMEYTGNFRNDKLTNGKLAIKDKLVYFGDFGENSNKEIVFHGRGNLDYINHKVYDSYVGGFANGEIKGFGEMKYRNNSYEKGYFIRCLDKFCPANNSNDSDIYYHNYRIFLDVSKFYPTFNNFNVSGFNFGRSFICEKFSCEQNRLKKEEEIKGKCLYNVKLNKTVFEFDSNLESKEIEESKISEIDKKINLKQKEIDKINLKKIKTTLDKEKLKDLSDDIVFFKRTIDLIYERNNYKNQIVFSDKKSKFEIIMLKLKKNNGELYKFNYKMTMNSIYFGGLNNDLEMEGLGKITYLNGNNCIGKFQNDMFNGRGKQEKTKKGVCIYNRQKINIDLIETNKGTFVNGKLQSTLEMPVCQRTLEVKNKKEDGKKLFKNEYKEETGEFYYGNLVEGVKYKFSESQMIIGRFHVSGENGQHLNFCSNSEHSTPFCKGVYMSSDLKSQKNSISFGGKIVLSKHIRGKLFPYESAIKFYDIKIQANTISEYRISLISERTEIVDKVNNLQTSLNQIKSIHGKARIYKTNDNSPYMSEKSKHSELHEKTNILYEGEMVLGRYCGKGIIYYDNGDQFIGDIEDSYLDLKKMQPPKKGQFGTLVQPLVGIQTGFFTNELLNGKAITIFQNGIKYKGEMKEGKANGKGMLYFPDGNHYEGSFENDKMMGKSKFYYKNGDFLECRLDDKSNINGNGHLIKYQDGQMVEIKGQFIDNDIYGIGSKTIGDLSISGSLNEKLEPFGSVSITYKDLRAYGEVDKHGFFDGKLINRRNAVMILIKYNERIKYDFTNLKEFHLKALGIDNSYFDDD